MSGKRPARRCAAEGATHRILLAAVLIVATGAPVLAEDPCAKYDDAFAYNQCLASQGPKAHAARAIDPPAGESASAPGATMRGRVHALMEVVHHRNGRMVAEFTIEPSRGKARKRLPDDASQAAPSP
jgi:hypothetical protein